MCAWREFGDYLYVCVCVRGHCIKYAMTGMQFCVCVQSIESTRETRHSERKKNRDK